MKKLAEEVYEYFQKREADLLDASVYNKFAIFIPLMRIENELHILFEVRSKYVSQPGEICFPGGKVDAEDAAPAAAAVRELSEEIGISPAHVLFVGELDYMVTPSKSIFYPFLGEISSEASIQINKNEVEEVFTVPVKKLMKMEPMEHRLKLTVHPNESFPFHLIPQGEKYPWSGGEIQEQFYQHENYIIWGLTARLLKHALEEMEKAAL